MNFSGVVVAAGEGLRAGPGAPKAWRLLAGRPILRWSVEALLAAGAQEIAVVVAKDRVDGLQHALDGLSGWRAVTGGPSRAASVQAGLAALATPADQPVLIHDAARPFVSASHVERLLAALADAEGAVPVLPVADTLKRGQGVVTATVSRDGLWRAQTPQAFRIQAMRDAYAAWPADEDPTDDSGVVERAGGRVALVAGDPILMKLTYPEDFAMAEQLAGGQRITRTGLGVDAHRFGPGDGVWLGGVRLPHSHGLVGHSDADAGLHALTDALLGALAEGDIGQHFPPSDPQWKDVSSDRFLAHAVRLAEARGGRVLSADLTLICERPKIGPHRDAIRARVAEIMGLPLSRVSVKATTTEGLGFTGEKRGLKAVAVVTALPD